MTNIHIEKLNVDTKEKYVYEDNEDEDNDEEDNDEEEEIEKERNKIRNGETYKNFENQWNKFRDKCQENNILVRSEFTCCDTCGNYDIYEERGHGEEKNKYYAYIFYHEQDAERIFEMCKNGKKEIKIHLSWNYFDKNGDDVDCIKLAKKIYEFSKSIDCDLEYKNISRKLILKIRID